MKKDLEDMTVCKFCQSDQLCKNGFVRGLQRYKCKSCKKNFTITPLRGVPEKDKLKAIVLYSSGLSMNRISKLFGVSATAVLKWVRAFGKDKCFKIEPSSEDKVIVMEVDEFWHFVKKKSKNFGSLKPTIVIKDGSLIGNLVIAPMQHSKDFLSD